MKQNLQAMTVYLTELEKREIDILAQSSGEAKSAIIRDALARGLEARYNEIKKRSGGSPAVQALLKLKGIIKDPNMPKDGSVNHDKYIWDEEVK